MKVSKKFGLTFAALAILALIISVPIAACTCVTAGTCEKNHSIQGAQLHEYNISQTLSDQAQRMTIAFDALGFLTGTACCDTFLPPGKVADYAGFQYLRDNDPSQMGHNTDFVTRASDNVLYILNDSQLAEFIALSKTESPLSRRYAYMRFPLIKAFRALLEGNIPASSSGLNRSAVMAYSAKLYDVDANISLQRAKSYANVIRSLNQTQRTYLDRMASGGMLSWPVVNASEVLKKCGQGNSVAMRTYASEMFSWYAGSVEADVYFCPERQATYFGSFYMKDRPAMGKSNYSIDTNLTGKVGEEFLNVLNEIQREKITSLVDIQRADLNEIVAMRQAIAVELRRALTGETINESAVHSYSARYGELDGEISYSYATHFAEVDKTVTNEQEQQMIVLRNLSNFLCEGAYLYSQPISMPRNIPSDFLFGVGSYNSSQMDSWIQGLLSPDLAISSSEISFSNSSPLPGENIGLNAIIHNIGNADANNASVLFYDGSPEAGKLIGKATINVGSGKTVPTKTTWNAVPGEHQIYVRIDPQNEFIETNYSNNEAHLNISVDNPPGIPAVPSGPNSSPPGVTCGYTTSSNDPDGDQIAYTFDWGDGTSSATGLIDSGTIVMEAHHWAKAGTYKVRARATDRKGASSIWSNQLIVTINSLPNTPSIPSGLTAGYTRVSYSYSTSATDPDGDQVKYTLDWGDGTSTVTGLVNSGTIVSASHGWNAPGTYIVKSMVTDTFGAISNWSNYIKVTMKANNPPETPSMPSGPSAGHIGISYNYSTSSTDPDGDLVKYTIDWGDGTTSNTLFVSSGTTSMASHTWMIPGTFNVKAKATDISAKPSNWSATRAVTMTVKVCC